jgi:hypothetical protein
LKKTEIFPPFFAAFRFFIRSRTGFAKAGRKTRLFQAEKAGFLFLSRQIRKLPT